MLEQAFFKVVNMSWEAGIVIMIVCIVRVLLRNFPKVISYMLWSVVFFRLLCPVTLETPVSPVPKLNSVFPEYTVEKDMDLPKTTGEFSAPSIDGEAKNGIENEQSVLVPSDSNRAVKETELSRRKLLILLGKYLWVAGIGIMFLYSIVSAAKIYNRVSVAIPFQENIYIVDEAISPFVLGIFNPKIYLPENLDEKEQEYIILHEKFHIKRLDYITKLIAFAALCIHWFNPLVWSAFILFCKDMEMSCDEAVIRQLGENIRADYSASLLSLSTKHRVIRGFPVDFGEGDTKGRVKNLAGFRKTKKWVFAILMIGVIILIVCLAFNHRDFNSSVDNGKKEINIDDNKDMKDKHKEGEQFAVSLNITEHYITSTGDPSNFYYIDKDYVLWGSGRNEYGQLGQGTQDYDFYGEMVKIADNVIHVDYSQKGFAIFLTNDYKLYGVGNAGSGALGQYGEFDWTRYANGENYVVTTPILLMEDVIYANCGRDDIVCLKNDGTVWTWGTVYAMNYMSNDVYYIAEPEKILEHAILVTGGWFNHAALLQDGSVWTWGYNNAGNCGVANPSLVRKPTMVAQEATMVWTNLAIDSYPQPEKEQFERAWIGAIKYNTEYENVIGLGDVYPYHLNNTVIQKEDGSYWVCGENVGTEEKIVHGEEGDYSVICSYEFFACE